MLSMRHDGTPSMSHHLQAGRTVLREVIVRLMDDQMRLYLVVELYGKQFSWMLDGRVQVEGGRLRFTPVRGLLGFLPLPLWLVKSTVRQWTDAVVNQDILTLPPHVKNVRIEHGSVAVS